MKQCVKCGTDFIPTKGLISFCSIGCRNSRQRTDEVKSKISKGIRSSTKFKLAVDRLQGPDDPRKVPNFVTGRNVPKTRIKYRNCTNCSKLFVTPMYKQTRTVCSDACYIAIKKQNYRGRKYLYNGEEFDSSWEIELVKFFNANDVEWQRHRVIMWTDNTGKQRRYFPDFYLPKYDVYIDPKNPICIDKQKDKLEAVSKIVNLKYGHLDALIDHIIWLRSSTE